MSWSMNRSREQELNDTMLESMWDELSDHPYDSKEEVILADFYHFKAKTDKMEIWEWFDKSHSKGVYWLLYERERELKDTMLESMWDELEFHPYDAKNRVITRAFYHFKAGTPRIVIWKWFNKNYSKGVVSLMRIGGCNVKTKKDET